MHLWKRSSGSVLVSSNSEIDYENILGIKFKKASKMQVKCLYSERGCMGMFSKKDLQVHTEQCGFSFSCCPLSNSCKPMLKKDLYEHLTNVCPQRKVECVMCKKDIIFSESRIHLEKFCDDSLNICPNGCGKFIARKELINHQSECTEAKIECEFKPHGCESMIYKNEVTKHNSECTDKHMALLCKKLVLLDIKNNLLTIEVETLKLKNKNLEDQLAIRVKNSPILRRNSFRASDEQRQSSIVTSITLRHEYDFLPTTG